MRLVAVMDADGRVRELRLCENGDVEATKKRAVARARRHGYKLKQAVVYDADTPAQWGFLRGLDWEWLC